MGDKGINSCLTKHTIKQQLLKLFVRFEVGGGQIINWGSPVAIRPDDNATIETLKTVNKQVQLYYGSGTVDRSDSRQLGDINNADYITEQYGVSLNVQTANVGSTIRLTIIVLHVYIHCICMGMCY